MSHVASHVTVRDNESCHARYTVCWGIGISHHSYQWVTLRVMSQVKHIWGSHVTYWMSHVTHWMRHVTRINESRCESCHTWNTYGWVMSHMWMSHVTRINESCWESCHTWNTYEWVMSHIVWVMSLLSTIHVESHVTHETYRGESCLTLNESCHSYQWVMSHMWMSHVTYCMSHVTLIDDSCRESCHTWNI